jgi:uncharacterized protein YjbI with pentapeptide repeats
MNEQTIESNNAVQGEPPISEVVEIKRLGTKEKLVSFEIVIDPQSVMPADRQRCAALDNAIRQAAVAGVDLRGADLSNRDLRYLNLVGLDLRGADLSGSVLDNTLLTFANLSDANLRDARMLYGSLAHANLLGACLIGARFSQADLTGALVWTINDDGRRGKRSTDTRL